MRYAKRFAGLALAAGMLMGVGTLSAAERRDPYPNRARVNEHKVVVVRPVKIKKWHGPDIHRGRRIVRRDSHDYGRSWR